MCIYYILSNYAVFFFFKYLLFFIPIIRANRTAFGEAHLLGLVVWFICLEVNKMFWYFPGINNLFVGRNSVRTYLTESNCLIFRDFWFNNTQIILSKISLWGPLYLNGTILLLSDALNLFLIFIIVFFFICCL